MSHAKDELSSTVKNSINQLINQITKLPPTIKDITISKDQFLTLLNLILKTIEELTPQEELSLEELTNLIDSSISLENQKHDNSLSQSNLLQSISSEDTDRKSSEKIIENEAKDSFFSNDVLQIMSELKDKATDKEKTR